MTIPIKNFIKQGSGEILICLHGLFGSLINWQNTLDFFSKKYTVVIPTLPIYDLPIYNTNLEALLDSMNHFIEIENLKNVTLIGNSLGGHLALLYNLKKPENVKRLVLTGSSGLYENLKGNSSPKRNDYEYVDKKVRSIFFDPEIIDENFVSEIFYTIQNIHKAIRIVKMAKSTQRSNLANSISNIKNKTLLIWGINDNVTPVNLAYEFNRLIPNSQLELIDKCAHAPMMEQPKLFNSILDKFLETE